MKNILEVFFTKMLRIMPEIISKGEKSRLKYLKMYLQTNYIPETNQHFKSNNQRRKGICNTFTV